MFSQSAECLATVLFYFENSRSARNNNVVVSCQSFYIRKVWMQVNKKQWFPYTKLYRNWPKKESRVRKMSSEKVNKCWSTHQLTDSYINTVAAIKPNNTQDSPLEQASLHLGLSYRECLFCRTQKSPKLQHWSLLSRIVVFCCLQQDNYLGAVEDRLGAFHLLLGLVQSLLVVPERWEVKWLFQRSSHDNIQDNFCFW